ncbi:MAG: hypothetical protein JKY54_18905 [Flavobacteriales bacterium]|nr:hypothetical protein [Flavobacteriales bacterium]
MIVEQAGGKSMNMKLERILELEVKEIHQRTSIAIGSPDMVDEMKDFITKYSAVSV